MYDPCINHVLEYFFPKELKWYSITKFKKTFPKTFIFCHWECFYNELSNIKNDVLCNFLMK